MAKKKKRAKSKTKPRPRPKGRVAVNTSPPAPAAKDGALPEVQFSSSGPGGQRPTISACMIVKDEEQRIETALKSIKPWVDEIVVVDTGSTDRTVEICESYGARVFHHPWQNNFAIHRNQSIAHATGDWLLIIDADEELDQKTAPLLHKMVHAPKDIAGFLFELYNDVSAGGETFLLHARMFRNHIGFRYDGKVHNRPVVPGNMARCGVKLIHYGYNVDPETMAKKHKRRLDMIRKWCEEEPDNFQAHSYLAHTLLSNPETVAAAVDEAALALDLLKKQNGPTKHYPHIYYPLMNGLAILQRDDEVLKHARDCLEISPYYPDPVFFMVGVEYKRQNWETVCEKAKHFRKLQEECRKHPERFVFFENMSYDQKNFVYFRWTVAAAHLGRRQECKDAFAIMIGERDAEEACKRAVQTLLAMGHLDIALELLPLADEQGWEWVKEIKLLVEQKQRESQADELKKQGLAALDQGQAPQAAQLLHQARDYTPQSPEVLLSLGKALYEEGKLERAEVELMKGLNGYPFDAEAWHKLGEQAFARGDYASAEACYSRYLGLVAKDEAVTSRLAVCRRRMTQDPPTVAMGPPRLVVFLVSGMAPEMVRQPAPHFLMGKAWGELFQDSEPPPDHPNWATIYTGVGPEVHGLTRDITRNDPVSLADLKVPTMWELLPPDMTLGLVGIPLGCPPPRVKGWSLAGYPGGLLTPEMVHPPELALRALAAGYRTDFLLNHFDDQTFAQRLAEDIRQEAFLYQMERNKLITAMNLPAVDVLVIGLTVLERIQNTYDLAHQTTFEAYQHVYGWIESLMAALRPLDFAVLSQRGYAHRNFIPKGGGFYCLSWLKGEDHKAKPTDIAPAILKLLGGDLSRLGKPRQEEGAAA